MIRDVSNPNLRRRPLPGLLALAGGPLLRLLLFPLRRRSRPDAPITIFESYMVGDFFMALPALKTIAAALPVQVACRADCAEFLEREGIAAVPFANTFRVRPGVATFLATWRAAWRLRGNIGDALDLDADPRTAFWLRVAGAERVRSYRRAYGILFDETFPLPPGSVHQADRDMAVVGEFLRRYPLFVGSRVSGDGRSFAGNEHRHDYEPATAVDDKEAPNALRPAPCDEAGTTKSSWLLSVRTRKPAKNWPLARWEELMMKLREEGIPFAIVDAPDGDAEYGAFRGRWEGRVTFVRASLSGIADRVREAAGVVATDNFLGHMAGYFGKAVLWINFRSPAEQVEPRGPCTRRVQAADPARAEKLTAEEVWRAFARLRADAADNPREAG